MRVTSVAANGVGSGVVQLVANKRERATLLPSLGGAEDHVLGVGRKLLV